MSDTTAIVLAGGYATRLWPITKDRSKVLLPVDENKTVIDGVLEDITDDDRISEVYVSTNRKFADDMRGHIKNKGYDNVTVSVENTEKESEKLGVIGALSQLVDRESLHEDDLFVVGGDNYMNISYQNLIDNFTDTREMSIVGYDVGSKERAASYGVLETTGDYLDTFREKPENPQSTYISTACYLIPSDCIMFDEYLQDDNNPDEPGWYIQWMNERTDIRVIPFSGKWFDIGTRDSYLEAVKFEMDGGSYVSPSSSVEDSEIGDNVLVLENSRVHESEISNTVVFSDTSIEEITTNNYLIDSNISISGAKLRSGMVGGRDQ